jgi:hypothetical protein
MAGAISAFLVAIGVLHLEVERFAESRIGVEWLPKSVGLLSNYGDLSILYGYVAVLLISHGRDGIGFLGGRFAKLMIWSTLLLGLAGSQSRNMILSTLIALGWYWIWRRIQNARSKQRTAVIGLFIAGAIMLPAITVFFGDTIVGSISTLGGKKAEHTAVQRIESYSKAISLLASEPFGVSYQTYKRYSALIDHIHNMWLKLLLNSGPIGMSAIAALFWLAYRGGSRPPQPPLLAAEPAMIVASVAAMFIAVEFYGGQTNIMWVMLGTLISFNWVRMQDLTKSVAT